MHVVNLERWTAACARAGAVMDVVESYHALCASYTEPPRAYHNLSHVDQCLAAFDQLAARAEHPVAVELAIWFHDAIYDTHLAENEARSAEFAVHTLGGMGLPAPICRHVAALILHTRHDQAPTTRDGEIIIDVDLAILASPREEYDDYEAQIRQEYAWVDAILFRSKRREFLTTLLHRSHIYHTPLFRTACEAPARHNLQRAIGMLEN